LACARSISPREMTELPDAGRLLLAQKNEAALGGAASGVFQLQVYKLVNR